jgi:hypothetical protein
LRQRLRRLRRRLAGFDRENANFLRFSSVKDYEIVLRQIRDWAVLVPGDDTYLNQPSGNANPRGLRRFLRPHGNRGQPERKEGKRRWDTGHEEQDTPWRRTLLALREKGASSASEEAIGLAGAAEAASAGREVALMTWN